MKWSLILEHDSDGPQRIASSREDQSDWRMSCASGDGTIGEESFPQFCMPRGQCGPRNSREVDATRGSSEQGQRVLELTRRINETLLQSESNSRFEGSTEVCSAAGQKQEGGETQKRPQPASAKLVSTLHSCDCDAGLALGSRCASSLKFIMAHLVLADLCWQRPAARASIADMN
ncbi:hypothetical protein BD289DRAFT_89575 [Coniella lustricola]|uniref:Uncharacterized protein n=1 Tax=Coniella lustricola TaxID=2025994 RepID=A0A2T2ZYI9_9PEZI|nr:hypothetical protein BD289DRAFT_89575 [Coniella lustricola]